jgi:hypothetical protein
MMRYAPPLQLPAGIPPGRYRLWLRLTRESDQRPLTTGGNVDLLLSPSVMVGAARAPQDLADLPPHIPVGARFANEIELAGYRIPEGQYRPGHVLPLDLFWQALRPPSADYLLRAQLLNSSGAVVAEEVAPIGGGYRPAMWREGELIADQVQLVIPATAGGGRLTLRLALIDPETGKAVRAGPWPWDRSRILGEVAVAPWPMETELPPIANPLRADFGQPPLIELHGYELSSDSPEPGTPVELTLVWRAVQGDMPANYTVLIHLEDEEGEIVAQGDGPPDNGFRLTTSWREGEVIVDRHTIELPAGLGPGSHRLWVGLYDPETGQRLPAVSNGALAPDSRLFLQSILVEE